MIAYVFQASEPNSRGLACVANITVYPPHDAYQSQTYAHVVITQLRGDYMSTTSPLIVKHTLLRFLKTNFFFLALPHAPSHDRDSCYQLDRPQLLTPASDTNTHVFVPPGVPGACTSTVSKKTGSCWGDFFLGGRLHLREQS